MGPLWKNAPMERISRNDRPCWVLVGGRRRLGRALAEDLARDHDLVLTSSEPWDGEAWVEAYRSHRQSPDACMECREPGSEFQNDGRSGWLEVGRLGDFRRRAAGGDLSQRCPSAPGRLACLRPPGRLNLSFPLPLRPGSGTAPGRRRLPPDPAGHLHPSPLAAAPALQRRQGRARRAGAGPGAAAGTQGAGGRARAGGRAARRRQRCRVPGGPHAAQTHWRTCRPLSSRALRRRQPLPDGRDPHPGRRAAVGGSMIPGSIPVPRAKKSRNTESNREHRGRHTIHPGVGTDAVDSEIRVFSVSSVVFCVLCVPLLPCL